MSGALDRWDTRRMPPLRVTSYHTDFGVMAVGDVVFHRVVGEPCRLSHILPNTKDLPLTALVTFVDGKTGETPIENIYPMNDLPVGLALRQMGERWGRRIRRYLRWMV